MKLDSVVLIPFLGTMFFAFNNCSQYSSSKYENTTVENQKSNDNSGASVRTACKVTQQSGTQLLTGSSVNFMIEYTGPIEDIDYNCNNQGKILLGSVASSPQSFSVNNLSAGNYSCVLYGKTVNAAVTCSNVLQFSVVDSFIPQPSPTPSPSPSSPSTSPLPTPLPSPSPTNGTPSNPAFASLHQNSITFNKSSGVDANGVYYIVKTDPLIGFKNQFPPEGTPGCTMGYPELRSYCDTVNGGFGFILNGYTDQYQFKVYIPKGTVFFSLSGFLPQSVKYAVAVKLGSPPLRTASLSDAEYEQAKSAQNYNTDFYRLQNGEELIMVHDGGGNPSFSGTARLSNNPITTGKWLYVRVINNSSIYNLGAVYEVNRYIYKQSFYEIPFINTGDPQ